MILRRFTVYKTMKRYLLEAKIPFEVEVEDGVTLDEVVNSYLKRLEKKIPRVVPTTNLNVKIICSEVTESYYGQDPEKKLDTSVCGVCGKPSDKLLILPSAVSGIWSARCPECAKASKEPLPHISAVYSSTFEEGVAEHIEDLQDYRNWLKEKVNLLGEESVKIFNNTFIDKK